MRAPMIRVPRFVVRSTVIPVARMDLRCGASSVTYTRSEQHCQLSGFELGKNGERIINGERKRTG